MIDSFIPTLFETIRFQRVVATYFFSRLELERSGNASWNLERIGLELKLGELNVENGIIMFRNFFFSKKPLFVLPKTNSYYQPNQAKIEYIFLRNTFFNKLFQVQFLLFLRSVLWFSIKKTKLNLEILNGKDSLSFLIKIVELPSIIKTKLLDLYGFSGRLFVSFLLCSVKGYDSKTAFQSFFRLLR